MASTSVHKATDILRFNYILYGIIMVTSVITFKPLTAMAIIMQTIVVIIDAMSLLLGTLSTIRCVRAEQVGCIHALPASMTCLVLVALLFLLDAFQCWSLYRILRMATFSVSGKQRVRILFAWALPFAWVNAILLTMDNTWTPWVVTHIIIDPMVIVMGNTDETVFLLTIIGIVILSDVFAAFWIQHDTVHMSILIQLFLSVASFFVLWFSTSRTRPKTLPEKSKVEKTAVGANKPPLPETMKSRKKLAF